jgi:hypothetical protein
VLADDARHRAVPIWMQAEPGDSGLSQILELTARPAGEIVMADAPEELTARLLHAAAALSSAVPKPAGFAFLGQEMYADDYRGAVVTFRGEFRTEDPARPDHASPDHASPDHASPDHASPDHASPDHASPDHASPAAADHAGLFLRANREWDIRGPLTEHAVLADPNNTILPIAAASDWTTHEVTARVPDDADLVVFGIFLAGPGRIELRHPELRHPELRHP